MNENTLLILLGWGVSEDVSENVKVITEYLAYSNEKIENAIFGSLNHVFGKQFYLLG